MAKRAPVIQLIILISFNFLYTSPNWHIENGWTYKDGKKFFAIGIWGIPDYQPVLLITDSDSRNIEIFRRNSHLFNLIFIQFAREQKYMQQNLLATGFGHFLWKLKDGYNGLPQYKPDKDGNGIIDLSEMKFIKNNLYPYFNEYFKNIVLEIKERFREFDHIWFISDEPNTGFNDWFWYPSIINTYYQAIKMNTNLPLTYIDLSGNVRGDRYSYEINFIKKYGKSLESLPAGENRNLLQGDPQKMQSYVFSADGIPVYKFNENSKSWIYNDLNLFDNKIYYNIYQVAQIYGLSCDVLGLNAYFDFYRNPALSGVSVRAMKDACGDYKPIWLFFDGAGHAKPESVSDEEYINNVKCQVYCSIVHGASGILFWSTKETSDNYWSNMKKLVEELNLNSELFKSREIDSGTIGDLHYSVREKDNGEKNIIVVNTNKESAQETSFYNHKIFLKPLEVLIISR